MQTITLGRGADSDFSIDHPTVSRNHAVLTISEGDVLEISDSNSTNGLFVTDEGAWLRVRSARLRSGDSIRLGEAIVPVADILAAVARKSSGAAAAPTNAVSRPPASPSAAVTRPGAGSAAGAGGGEEPIEKFRRPRRNPNTGAIEEGG